MVKPVFSLFDNFKVGSTADALSVINGLTKLDPKTNKEVNTRHRLSEQGYAVSDIYGIEKTFEIEGEYIAGDTGSELIVSMEDCQGEDAKLFFSYTAATGDVYTGTVVCDITTVGGEANALITYSGTLHVYGKPTKVQG